jgi:hypothetical protein
MLKYVLAAVAVAAFGVSFIVAYAAVRLGPVWLTSARSSAPNIAGEDSEQWTDSFDDASLQVPEEDTGSGQPDDSNAGWWEVEYDDQGNPVRTRGVRPRGSSPRGGNAAGRAQARIRTISTGERVELRNHVARSGSTIVEFTAQW